MQGCSWVDGLEILVSWRHGNDDWILEVWLLWEVWLLREAWLLGEVWLLREAWRVGLRTPDGSTAVSKIGEIAIISGDVPVLADWALIFKSHAIITFVETLAVCCMWKLNLMTSN